MMGSLWRHCRLPFRLFSSATTAGDAAPSLEKYVVLPTSKYYRKGLRGQKFVDRKNVEVSGGAGGTGCVSLMKSRINPHGVPDGGDGGKGGSIYLLASRAVQDLSSLRPAYTAPQGAQGSSAQKNGRSGRDLSLRVPIGTLVLELDGADRKEEEEEEEYAEEEEEEEEYEEEVRAQAYRIVADLREEGQSICVARGGVGGQGNQILANKSRKWRTSRGASVQKDIQLRPGLNADGLMGKRGQPGEVRNLLLELQSLCDIGLVGLPSSGKSSLLAALTNASPKIAPWQFTTVTPQLGVLPEKLGSAAGSIFPALTIAEVPGILSGASDDRGLGLAFLRHIQRSHALLYVVRADSDHGLPGQPASPLEHLRILREECGSFDASLLQRPSLIALTQCDRISSDAISKLVTAVQEECPNVPVLAVSSLENVRMDALEALLRQITTPKRMEQMARKEFVEPFDS